MSVLQYCGTISRTDTTILIVEPFMMFVSSRGNLVVSVTVALLILFFPTPGLTLFLLMYLMQFVVVHGHCKSEQSLIA